MTQFEKDDRDEYLMEYTSENAIARYTSETAGKGIEYVLTNIYGPLYSKIIDSICLESTTNKVFRALEYGCGAGMNLLHIFKLLKSKGVTTIVAIGTDFSKPLLQAADREKEKFILAEDRKKIKFLQASNESLLQDLAAGLVQEKSTLLESFDLIVGVNTFRYMIRLHKQQNCANDIASLLAPGAYSIMIDMNDRFPFFRSRFRIGNRKSKQQARLPSLKEYTEPFRSAGLEILQARNFCWIPHSASVPILILARLLTPFLDLVSPNLAMRSLVVARKKGASTSQRLVAP